MATQMWNKFSKYWSDFNLLLAIAVVFDPRYKFTFVEFSYKKLYGEGSLQLKMVEDTLFALYDEYMHASKNSTACESTSFQGSNDNESRQGNVEGGPSHSILEVNHIHYFITFVIGLLFLFLNILILQFIFIFYLL